MLVAMPWRRQTLGRGNAGPLCLLNDRALLLFGEAARAVVRSPGRQAVFAPHATSSAA